MEYNPSLTPTYLAGKVDEYVKYQARDTIVRNAKRDRNCRYARIPDGNACDFCKMLGSRGFVYHSEFKAGGDGNDYHPYCNCQLAVSFDPFIEKYEVVSESGTIVTVTHGYGMEDAELVRPGRDRSFDLRHVDIDELFDEYKAMGRKFTAKSKYKDYTRGAKLTDEQFEDAMRRLSEARTLDELHEAGKDIVDRWPKNENGRDKRQWHELSKRARELEKQLENVYSRSASKGTFDGAFGNETSEFRSVYTKVDDDAFVDDMIKLFNKRNDGMMETEGSISRLGKDNTAALLSGIEYGGVFVGTRPDRVKLISSRKLAKGALAQTERRGNDVIIRVNISKLRGMTQDQIEQIAFHEMAHTVEYSMVSDAQFAKEAGRLAEFQRGTRKELPASIVSKHLEKALQDAGLQARYIPMSGKIEFTGDSERVLYELPRYAWDGADLGTQDSELIAESIRYVALNGYGKNAIADTVARAFIGG